MIFLDTCIWMELLVLSSPKTEIEKRKAIISTHLFANIIERNERIITCNEQLIELVKAIEKRKKEEVNKDRRKNGIKGLSSLKDFRSAEEYKEVKLICNVSVNTILSFSEIKDFSKIQIDDILSRLEIADINDLIYYDYCDKNKIDFYSIDKDIINIGHSEYIHCFDVKRNEWIS